MMAENKGRFPRAAICTLGCKVNQYESEAIAEGLRAAGFTIVPFDARAEVYIINTCTVTAESDRKACQMIRRAVNRRTPNEDRPFVLVTGCMAQTQAERIQKIEGVSYICGSRNKLSCVERACAYVQTMLHPVQTETAVFATGTQGLEAMCIHRSESDRTRAYVKIEDGCENRCTYCAIPASRGHVVSKRPQDVLYELSLLAQNGYQEVVLTGIEIASYGADFKGDAELDGYHLVDLLEAADKTAGITRIRLGSMEPTYMKPETVSRMAALQHLTHHFHLSLQSGADHVLHGMKRKYNMRQVREILADIRAKMPDVMFTTDIMTGFPGETEEDFAQTCAFVEEARLLHVHVFPYSRRKHTAADQMEGQLDNAEKNRRAGILIAVQNAVEADIYQEFAACRPVVTFLAETCKDGIACGHTANFFEVHVPVAQPLPKSCFSVQIDGAGDTYLTGQIVPYQEGSL